MYEEIVQRLRHMAKIYSICENENTNEYKLSVQAADAIESMSEKMKFYSFLCRNLPKHELETLLTIYRGQEDEE